MFCLIDQSLLCFGFVMILGCFSSLFFIYLCALLSISFFTLFERKVLACVQKRVGPNKVGVLGVFQPFADALKLFSKEINAPTLSNYKPFIYTPRFALFLSLTLWCLYPCSSPSSIISFRAFFFICASSLGVYATISAGWTSNSIYSLLGSLRGVAQTISYEVCIGLVLLSCLVGLSSFRFIYIYEFNSCYSILLFIPLFNVWFISVLAETNRTPFDFAEGESELVSGFNTEYRGCTFALIFMAEYLNILAISLFTSLLFLRAGPSNFIKDCIIISLTLLISGVIILIRASLPRMRYDRLIILNWKVFLPFSLRCIILFSCIVTLLWHYAGLIG